MQGYDWPQGGDLSIARAAHLPVPTILTQDQAEGHR